MIQSSPSPALSPRLAGGLALASVYFIWGSTYLGIKVAVTSMPPLLMSGGRFVIAGLALLLFLRL
ncbi:drug/metabolite exporter YedA, partial [Salmonella sp. zj-f50]